MSPKIKNIIIFVGIGLVLVVLYIVLFSNTPSEEENFIVSSTTQEDIALDAFSAQLSVENTEIAQEFLAELLSVKSLQLDDAIFAGIVFTSLKDPDVVIVQDEKEGRPNPFAPIGFGVTPTSTTPVVPVITPTTTPAITPTTTTTSTTAPTTTGSTTTSTSTNPVNPTTPVAPTTPTNTPTNPATSPVN